MTSLQAPAHPDFTPGMASSNSLTGGNLQDADSHGMRCRCVSIKKPGPGLIRSRSGVTSFIGQPGSIRKNFKKIFKTLIFHVKKLIKKSM
jgi:hypothetical protein